jgi:prevent-host-death family protein
VEQVGLRELRQQASELVRRAEQGEELLVTVSGRPAARLGPASARLWRRYDEIATIFDGPEDASWPTDREQLEASPRDPWPS